MTATQTERIYPRNPASSLDSISGAIGFVRREYGDYGYRVSIEARGLYGVRFADGSEFFVASDHYGNARRVEWNGSEWVTEEEER